ncbi:MAG: antibiotic biosynthesis monooxygenase [Flavobacteriales bacterium]|nr:antibiotic biosynthesis monooxygenase [Flavobacteriales bacterium]
MIASTPSPPYYAVIFTSLKSADQEGYSEMAEEMVKFAQEQPGFLGYESTGEEPAITVSYWRDLDSIKKWKSHAEHLQAQLQGREKWYSAYKTRICLVERDYGFDVSQG